MACEIFSKSAAAVKNFFRANAAALAVTIPMLAASAVAVVASQLVTDMPVVYGHFEWGIFGDALIVLILFMAALYRRCRWCAP